MKMICNTVQKVLAVCTLPFSLSSEMSIHTRANSASSTVVWQEHIRTNSNYGGVGALNQSGWFWFLGFWYDDKLETMLVL